MIYLAEKTFEERLIEAVQCHNCLYDKSLRTYRNKLVKEKAWREVANVVGAEIKQCQDRWRSLRDRYVREVAKVPKSGSAAVEKSGWTFFKPLSYLKGHVAPRRTISNTLWSLEETGTTSSPEPLLTCEVAISPEPELFHLDASSCSAVVFPRPSCSADTSSGSTPFAGTPSPSSTGGCKRNFKEAKEAKERLNKIMDTVTTLMATEVQKESRNADFLGMLDGYLLKLPEEKSTGKLNASTEDDRINSEQTEQPDEETKSRKACSPPRKSRSSTNMKPPRTKRPKRLSLPEVDIGIRRTKTDSSEHFGRYVSAQIRKLPKKEAILLQHEIQKSITRALLKSLRDTAPCNVTPVCVDVISPAISSQSSSNMK